MKNPKLIALLMSALLLTPIFAQERQETTAEQEYLQGNWEDMIITELTAAPDRESKEDALKSIESAINNGRNSKEIEAALYSLAGEGVFKESRMNGRISNNYPDIRAKACDLLGQIGNEYCCKTLTKVVLSDNEPMVTSSAVKALGNANLDNCDDVVTTIAYTEKRFGIMNPTDSLANDILDAYEKLAPNVKDRKDMIRSISEIASNERYKKAVRDKARRLLADLIAM